MSKRKKLPKYCIEDTDRYGKVRVYLRVPGQRKVALTGVPWSQAFMEAYGEALSQVPAKKTSERKANKNTFRWLCELYYESPGFNGIDEGKRKGLNERSRRVRRQIL